MTTFDPVVDAATESCIRDGSELFVQNRSLLAALAGHELREPVQAIQSFLSVVLEGRTGPLNALQQDFLATANQAAKRLAQRIEDVQLALSCEDDPFQLTFEPVNLRDRAERCCRELSLTAYSHDVALEIDASGWCDDMPVNGDADRVDQVLLNLLENGIRYAKPNTTLRITIRTSTSGAGAVIVRNELESQPVEDPRTWFEPFERGATGKERRAGGLGLGLAVVSYLMHAHRGQVTAHAEGNYVYIGVIFPGVEYIEPAKPKRVPNLRIAEPVVVEPVRMAPTGLAAVGP